MEENVRSDSTKPDSDFCFRTRGIEAILRRRETQQNPRTALLKNLSRPAEYVER